MTEEEALIRAREAGHGPTGAIPCAAERIEEVCRQMEYAVGGGMSWIDHGEASYFVRQLRRIAADTRGSAEAISRVKAALARRSQPTMDPPYTAAFNAALDMVAAALTEQEGK